MDPEALLREAYDADSFRAAGHRLVDHLADYLATCAGNPPPSELPVLPWREPDDWVAAFDDLLARDGEHDLQPLLESFIRFSNHLHHPRYVGHQVGVPLPAAALADFATHLLNNATAVYEMSPLGTALERACCRWLARHLGWTAAADGIFTSGGSLGNLTALLAARQAKAGFDVWSRGEAGGAPLAVLVGAESHYSVARGLQVMGLGAAGVVPVAVDAAYRLDPADLEPAYQRALADGRRPIAVVASSCSTATGAFDPLEPIAGFCAARDLWLHVDGAHGASAALSGAYRPLLAGIDRADSVVWDAHKMLMVPALCTAVLFRDGRRSYEAFAQEASYLLHQRDPRDEWYNLCGRTLECTKPSMALPLAAAIATGGERLFDAYVTSRFALGQRFGELLAAAPDFDLPVAPQGNIVCFRHRPPGLAPGPALDERQQAIRRAILREGSFYLVQTRLKPGLHLRVALMNPFTSEADLLALMDAVRRTPNGDNNLITGS